MNRLQTINSQGLAIMLQHDEARIAHRDMAGLLGLQPRHLLRRIEKHLVDYQALGQVRFESAKPASGKQGGRPERVALLNEDHCYLLATHCRNSREARQIKLKLVQAFRAARDALAVRHQHYLPLHHQAHASVQQMALYAAEHGSTTPGHLFHSNIERLINRSFGIEAGQRKALPAAMQNAISMTYLLVSNAITDALANGGDHKAAYREAEQRVSEFARLFAPQLRLAA